MEERFSRKNQIMISEVKKADAIKTQKKGWKILAERVGVFLYIVGSAVLLYFYVPFAFRFGRVTSPMVNAVAVNSAKYMFELYTAPVRFVISQVSELNGDTIDGVPTLDTDGVNRRHMRNSSVPLRTSNGHVDIVGDLEEGICYNVNEKGERTCPYYAQDGHIMTIDEYNKQLYAREG